VTAWGAILLAGFLTLGLRQKRSHDAMRAAVMLTVLVLVVVRFAVW
jgi:hypothetical protein